MSSVAPDAAGDRTAEVVRCVGAVLGLQPAALERDRPLQWLEQLRSADLAPLLTLPDAEHPLAALAQHVFVARA